MAGGCHNFVSSVNLTSHLQCRTWILKGGVVAAQSFHILLIVRVWWLVVEDRFLLRLLELNQLLPSTMCPTPSHPASSAESRAKLFLRPSGKKSKTLAYLVDCCIVNYCWTVVKLRLTKHCRVHWFWAWLTCKNNIICNKKVL